MGMRNVSVGMFAMAVGLVACVSSDSDKDKDSVNLAVTPSLGLVANATVKFYQSDSTTLLGEDDTGNSGMASIHYDGSYSGPVIVAVIGNEDAQYFDESIGSMVDFGAGQMLRALVPAGTSQAGVTVLTEAAYQLSIVNNIPLNNTAISFP